LQWISKNFPASNYLPNNTRLNKIDGVFRSINFFSRKSIYVAVEWESGKKSSLPIELANLLAPGRSFSGKRISHEVGYKKIKVTIQGEVSVDKTTAHYRYLYQTDGGIISISAFELARTLFFHNRHLVNAAYRANGISELAFVDRESTPPKIIFPESTRYPVSYLHTKKARAHFAWLLLEPEARNSLYLIYQYFRKNEHELAFNFEPPNLLGWRLELSIINALPQSDLLYVQRIENVLDARTSVNVVGVQIYHPKRKTEVETGGERPKKPGATPNVDTDPELDLGAIPAFGKRLHSQRNKGFSFNVSGIYDTTLVDGDETPKPLIVPNADPPTDKDKAGVGQPEKDGDSQEFDPTINQDDNNFEEAEKRPQKFLIFEQVVKELGKSKGIKLESIKCGVFPDPTNRSRVIFQTRDEHTLRFFIAILEINQSKIIMLEADTTSLIKAKGASTLILGLKDDAKTNLMEIIQHFSDSGAQWRHHYIHERVNYFASCNHPRLKSKGQLLSEDEYKNKWLGNLKQKLKELLAQK